MPLVTQAQYARHRGVSKVSVHKRTMTVGGPIPVHGPKKLIDIGEADALWEATMSPQGAARARASVAGDPGLETPAQGVTGSQLARARAAALVVDVQNKRLLLEQRRGALISKDAATLKAFAYTRVIRDAWLAWPARVGPQLAATFDLDPATVVVTLEHHVREQLDELASERVDF